MDIGGGASTLVDRLLERGHTDVTVLDVSAHALDLAQRRLSDRPQWVHWETADLVQWTAPRRFALWHDRAAFHFLTDPAPPHTHRRRSAVHLAADAPHRHLRP
ncbi:MAG: class I SAM-dependent methyltransferase, partial [Actinobacteria bacterium]|nr:class I SAM-dependent methyltransferase [Actinomycetota bacterium]